MNKIYRVIWSRVRHCYVVVSELARTAGKEKSVHLSKKADAWTVGAFCAGSLLFSGIMRTAAAAEPAAGSTARNQYVAFGMTRSEYNSSPASQTINNAVYNKVALNGNYFWVRDGYTLTESEPGTYTALSASDRRYDVTFTAGGTQPSDILVGVSSLVASTSTVTNAGETLNQVTASAFEGVSLGGGTAAAGGWDYIIYDPSWEGHAYAYRDGYANVRNSSGGSNRMPLGFVTTATSGSALAWDDTRSLYTYNGTPVDTNNLYVIDGHVGVFTNYDGSAVYTGTVYGANNEILKTVYQNGAYYSYWAAPVTEATATMSTYRVADYNNDLNTLVNNDIALYHNDVKSVDMAAGGTADAPSATISVMRNGTDAAEAVTGAITITGGGGTDGSDTFLTLSNVTAGETVSQTFSGGSRVAATTAESGLLSALAINGTSYAMGMDFQGNNTDTTVHID